MIKSAKMKPASDFKKHKPISKEETIALFKKNALEERGHELSDQEAEEEYELIELMAKIFVAHIMKEAKGQIS